MFNAFLGFSLISLSLSQMFFDFLKVFNDFRRICWIFISFRPHVRKSSKCDPAQFDHGCKLKKSLFGAFLVPGWGGVLRGGYGHTSGRV